MKEWRVPKISSWLIYPSMGSYSKRFFFNLWFWISFWTFGFRTFRYEAFCRAQESLCKPGFYGGCPITPCYHGLAWGRVPPLKSTPWNVCKAKWPWGGEPMEWSYKYSEPVFTGGTLPHEAALLPSRIHGGLNPLWKVKKTMQNPKMLWNRDVCKLQTSRLDHSSRNFTAKKMVMVPGPQILIFQGLWHLGMGLNFMDIHCKG